MEHSTQITIKFQLGRARARGVLWETYRKHYGAGGAPNVLIAKGTTRDFNPTIPQTEIDRELERDRARNTAELLAEFRSDLESYISLEVVESCVGDYFEMAPASGVTYHGFCELGRARARQRALCAGCSVRNRWRAPCSQAEPLQQSPQTVHGTFQPISLLARDEST
jgi:hypothetical protein